MTGGKSAGLAAFLSEHSGCVLTVEDAKGGPDAGLPVGYDLSGTATTVALVIPIEGGTERHQQVVQLAARVDGGRLIVPLSTRGARVTAGRLAVRADEVDVDNSTGLAHLVDAEQVDTLRRVAYSVLPPDMPDDQAGEIAWKLAEQIMALGWRPGGRRRNS